MHLPHFHYILNRELTELYASIALRNFTLGLVKVFEPIYLFVYFSQDISKTFLYFGSIAFLHGVLSPLGGKIVTKIGVKHSMLAAIPFLFLYYLGLWHIEALGNFFFLLVPVLVTHNLFYWTAFHIDFTRFSEIENRGKQLSYRYIVSALSAAVAPFAGGIILAQYDFKLLFAVVLILLFGSVFPLFLSREVHERYTDSFQKAFGEIFQKKYRGKAIAFFGEATESVAHFWAWPIFLFSLAISYSSIGLISSVGLFAGIIFVLYLGRLVDKMGHARLLSMGVWLNALTWPVKMFIRTPLDAFSVHTLHQLTQLTAHMPFGTLFYDWSGREDVNRDRFVIFREVVGNISKGIVFFGLAGIFLFIDNIAIAFPIAGASTLLLIFFIKGDRLNGKGS